MTRKLLILLLLVALAGVWYGLSDRSPNRSAADPQAEDPGLLVNRVWVDSKPQKYTDFVHVMLAVDYAPIGLFQKASSYEVHMELYEYKRTGNKLKLHFPQRDKSADVEYRIRACDELPPFDLCLDLSKNPWGGPRRYYGLRDSEAEADLLGAHRRRAEDFLPN